ncbi:DUF3365 domain-containing protein [Geobacter pelophilus]|uniref:DUF3365 domain-containing protein n=1 Tax=Geoanaerobacter pelophilus TaxID=60036 RepID=A0AAW4KYS7_9BACT|nr:DUF3365 domain-containing protein [Geoanaerobacter pelophilus]MBT0663703.1 DUF3365 domain-containing protein [Geoanaerobacter pelophilus]
MKEVNARKLFNAFYAITFIIVAIIIIITVNLHQRQRALHYAEEKTLILLEHNLAIHTYFSKQLKPKVFALTDATRSSSYFDPTWMSSTYAVREIDKYHRKISRIQYYYKECAVNARSPENEADAYEKKFLDELKRDQALTQRSVIRTIDGKPYFVLIRRGESMEQNCLRCHSVPAAAPSEMVDRYGKVRSFNRTDGELVSAISIRIPLAEAYEAANNFSVKFSIILLAILGLTFAAQYFVTYRLYLKPITSIRNQVMTIISDESRLGEKIAQESHSAEVNDLIRSFNELSHNLRAEKDGLVAQVQARTVELEEKVAQLEATLARVKSLEGIITICGYCKKICDDKDSWHQLEAYISRHSEALFSHGICPECFAEAKDKFEE